MVWKWVKNLFSQSEDEPDDSENSQATPDSESPPQDAPATQNDLLGALETRLLAPLETALQSSTRLESSLPDVLFDDHGEEGLTTALETLARQDPGAAIRVLRRYQRECPEHNRLLWRLGRLYASRKERQPARRVLARLTEDREFAADAHQLIAELCEEEGEPGEAVLHYQRALAWDWGRPGLLDQCRKLESYLPRAAPPPPLRIIAHEPPKGYRIEHPLGRGGFGTVYLARDQTLDRPVAMKFLHDHLRRQPRKVEQLFAEARLVAGLAHDGVVGVYELDRDRHLLIMEYMTHGTLADRLSAGRPLHPMAAFNCARQICDTLADVHEAGLVHRDLKPANVLFRMEGEAVLGDFGIAELETGEHRAGAGTRLYAAPETAPDSPDPIDRRTDVYGVGLLLTEMLTAVPPPLEPAVLNRWFKTAGEALPEPLRVAFVDWLRELTASQPSERPGDISEVAAVLATLVGAFSRKRVTTGV